MRAGRPDPSSADTAEPSPRHRTFRPVAAEADTDEARLSAFIRSRIGIGIGGHYAFHLPDLGGSHRPLRDPDSRDD
jgi:hypothetical protein